MTLFLVLIGGEPAYAIKIEMSRGWRFWPCLNKLIVSSWTCWSRGEGDEHWDIKIATGFFDALDQKLGLSHSWSTAGCEYMSWPSSTTELLKLFFLLCCTTLLSLQKTSLFLPQHRCKSRTETSNITHATSHKKPSQQASQRPHGRSNLT